MKMQNSPIARLGGKRNLRSKIISKMPPHRCYVETMCGGAWVFFGKQPSEVEVINDLDSDLINFFWVVKYAPHALKYELAWDLVSRELFQKYRKELIEYPELCNVRRAKDFYYTVKCGFGGMGGTFGYGKTEGPRLNFKEVDRIIHDTYERLLKTYIENLNYSDLIPRYDSPDTLFYVDPPYLTVSSKRYIQYWTRKDYEELNSILRGIKGKFMLSLNRVPLFEEELFKGFNIEVVTTTYSLNNKAPKKAEELLIMNF